MFSDTYTINPDGSNVQRLPNNPAHDYFDRAWSADAEVAEFINESAAQKTVVVRVLDKAGEAVATQPHQK